MRDHALKNKVERICMPKIGCGLDGLQWESGVRPIICSVFGKSNIRVDIYSL